MDESTVYINGLFTPLRNAKISILDRGFCYGDGLFETLRASNGQIFYIEQHIDRLFDSLQQVLIELPMTRLELTKAVKETLARNKYKNAIGVYLISSPLTFNSQAIESKLVNK